MLLVLWPSLSADAMPVAGDVDHSGSVNIVDLQFIVNTILQFPVPEDLWTDVNLSGGELIPNAQAGTNIVDLQIVVNAILQFDIDTDDDGLADLAEMNIGTNPGLFDTDGDGVGDGQEVFDGTNPLIDEGGEPAGPSVLEGSSPAQGESGVAVTRETVVRFNNPLDENTVSANAVAAEFAGNALAARLHVSPDRRAVTLFYDENLPASARVRVTVDGEQLLDTSGERVDVDNDGEPGGVETIEFDTLALATTPGTAVFGRVFASEFSKSGKGVDLNVPLADVRITVDGAETEFSTETDAQGNFRLEPAPAGRFFVHIDGRTVTKGVPAGAYYPFVGKAWDSIAGEETEVGSVHLPLVVDGTLQAVNLVASTDITFPSSVLSANPELEGVGIKVPANSLFSDNGTRGGQVGIAPVAPDRLPGALPPGLGFPIVITVQTDGPTNFDVPVPVCFPNLPAPNSGETLAPGEKSALWSFNHDTGRFEVVGSMTVTEDGTFVCSDPGVGILAPGWHSADPSSPVAGPSDPGADGETRLPSDGETCPEIEFGTSELAAAGSAAVTCADALLKLRGTVRLIVKSIKAMREIWSQANDLADNVGQGEISDAGILLGVDTLKNAKDPILAFLDEVEEVGSPVGKIADALACVRDIAAVAEGDCDSVQSAPDGCFNILEKSACTVIDGIIVLADTASSAVDYIDTALTDGIIKAGVCVVLDEITDLANEFKKSGKITDEQRAELLGLLNELIDLTESANLVSDESLESLEQLVGDVSEVVDNLGDSYVAREGVTPDAYYLVEAEGFQQRGIANSFGNIRFNLPADTPFTLAVFDPATFFCGAYAGITAPPGRATEFHGPILLPCDPADADADGLPDEAEDIVGTNKNVPDTDEDGILDGAEVEQGLDPLDGLAVRTGIIATADTAGTAVDVCARDNLVVVADSTEGIAVFNAFNGMNPTIVAQVDTPGSAQAVACSNTFVAVAGGEAGLAIVDISDLSNVTIVQHFLRSDLQGLAQTVAVAGTWAIVGSSNGSLSLVDMIYGDVLDHVVVDSSIHRLAIEGSSLYVLTDQALHVMEEFRFGLNSDAELPVPGATPVLEFGRNLAVGGGLAYVGYSAGFHTVDVSDLGALAIVGTPPPGQRAVHDVALNGSGLMLGVTDRLSVATLELSVFDISEPTDVTRLLTSFDTPGWTRAVEIFNGLAYVADHGDGLQVVNYLAYDSAGMAPGVSFEVDVVGGAIESGAQVFVSAAVTDDVQVRNVELLVDGEVIQTDGNYPFEFFLTAPLLTKGASIDISVIATDTGGNRTQAPTQNFGIDPDTTAPRVAFTSPREQFIAEDVSSLVVVYGEPLDQDTLNTGAFELLHLGSDEAPGGGDDTVVPIGSIAFQDDRRLLLELVDALPTGSYQLAIGTTAVTDLAGNPMASAFTLLFAALSEIPEGTSVWLRGGDGDWNDPLNWSGAEVPDDNDAVVIDVPGPRVTVTLDRNVRVSTIEIAEDLVLDGTRLTITDSAEIGGDVSFLNGSLILNANATASLTALTALTGPGATFTVDGGAVLNLPVLASITGITHAFTVRNGGELKLPALTTIDPTGNVFFTIEDASVLSAPLLASMHNTIFTVRDGAVVNLPSVTSCTYEDPPNTIMRVEGSGSQLNLPALTALSINSSVTFAYNIVVTTGATLNLSAVQAMTTSGLGSLQITLNGATSGIDLTALESLTNVFFTILNSVVLSLPSVTEYTWNNAISATTSVDGAASRLQLPVVTTMAFTESHTISCANGAQIELPILTSLSVSDDERLWLRIAGTSSLFDIPSITTLNNVQISVTSGAVVNYPGVTACLWSGNPPTLVLDVHGAGSQLLLPSASTVSFTTPSSRTFSIRTLNDGVLDLSGVQSLTTGGGAVLSLVANSGGQVDLSGLSTLNAWAEFSIQGTTSVLDLSAVAAITNTSFVVSGGSSLTLPSATSFTWNRNISETVMSASSAGSQLSFPALTSMTFDAGTNRVYTLRALSGGQLDLSAVQTITTVNGEQVNVSATTGGGQVDLSAATTLTGVSLSNAGTSMFSVDAVQSMTGGGLSASSDSTLTLPALTTITGEDPSITVNAGSTLSLPSLTSVNVTDRANIRVTGTGVFSVPLLATLHNAQLTVQSGAVVNLPAVTAYSWDNTSFLTPIDVINANSQLSMGALTSMDFTAAIARTFTLRATSGGVVDLSAVQTLVTDDQASLTVRSSGAGSQYDLSSLITYEVADVTFNALNGGVILLPPKDADLVSGRWFVQAGPSPAIAQSDLNGDEGPDQVWIESTVGAVVVRLSNQEAVQASEDRIWLSGVPTSLSVGDLNADSILDLVVGSYGSQTISVLYGTGAGVFRFVYEISVPGSPAEVEVLDVDGDGVTEIVTHHEDGQVLEFFAAFDR
jgi:hypothetical protein